MLMNEGRVLTVRFADGTSHGFHALWLRENSPHPENIDPTTRHKLHDSAFFPIDVRVQDARAEADELVLAFDDGHHCRYDMSALRAAAFEPFPSDLVGEKLTWCANIGSLPWHDLTRLEGEGAAVLDFLNDIARLGFALVRGVPLEPDGMTRLTDLIGFIRLTNSGGIADVKTVPQAYDLSMTTQKLEPHVDNPYRYPQPGFTLLHCLRNDADGGESILVDGFRVAELIREEDEALFDALVRVPVAYRYRDEQAILEYVAPFIDLWPDGSLKQTRFHGRCDQVVALDPETLELFYRARRRYAELIWSDSIRLTLKLSPGEMYFADNFRVFHGRAPFSLESGVRHMRQAYMDRDVVSSRQKTLIRDPSSKPWRPRVHE